MDSTRRQVPQEHKPACVAQVSPYWSVHDVSVGWWSEGLCRTPISAVYRGEYFQYTIKITQARTWGKTLLAARHRGHLLGPQGLMEVCRHQKHMMCLQGGKGGGQHQQQEMCKAMGDYIAALAPHMTDSRRKR